MVPNSELRAKARKTLGNGIFTNEWIFALLVSLIAGAVIGFTSSFLLGVLIIGIVNIGLNKYYLYRSRNTVKYDDFNILIDGVKVDVAGNLVLGLLITLFTALWSLLFVIPGIVKSYSYSMAYFLKIDHPEYTATQAIDESRRIMNGHKMKLFLLDLSFIGWLILGSLCFGIGTLWVNAYMQASRAEFYRDLVGETVIVTEA
ncbi:MAG: DUF975 family protein [Clostridiales bacterium]|nr:DUF975 family protein [Clostridiales bacterium]